MSRNRHLAYPYDCLYTRGYAPTATRCMHPAPQGACGRKCLTRGVSSRRGASDAEGLWLEDKAQVCGTAVRGNVKADDHRLFKGTPEGSAQEGRNQLRQVRFMAHQHDAPPPLGGEPASQLNPRPPWRHL